MMHYAHNSLLRSFSACSEDYVALPTGSGSTGAIEKAIKIIKSIEKDSNKPIIFLTPYEHHSNILPWVEFYDSVNVLASDEEGNLLLDKIEDQLISCSKKNIIVTASAASNVTSKITDL
jgi:selenocysteine lyase/cysteine desulfurase